MCACLYSSVCTVSSRKLITCDLCSFQQPFRNVYPPNSTLLRRGYHDHKVSGVGIYPVTKYPKGQEKENRLYRMICIQHNPNCKRNIQSCLVMDPQLTLPLASVHYWPQCSLLYISVLKLVLIQDTDEHQCTLKGILCTIWPLSAHKTFTT